MEDPAGYAHRLQEPFFEAIYMQISIPGGKYLHDSAINKKHIILPGSLRAQLLCITCACGYVLVMLVVKKRIREKQRSYMQ